MGDDEQITFQYANECDLEIHCSPFGLSGLYIKIRGTNIMGIGSTMGLITGSSTGMIHYNDSKDLMDQKYKLYVVVDDEGFIRIDFTKIFNLLDGESSTNRGNSSENDNYKIDGNGGEDIVDESPSYSTMDSPPLSKDDDDDPENFIRDEAPTIVFKGKCPEGRPDKVDPFIGIFSFEREN